MPKFLIDVNLPVNCPEWDTPEFIHQINIDRTWSDTQIWQYAEQKNLTIITKDADFSDRILLKVPPPKVIHIRFGNMKLKDFLTTISNCWEQAENMVESHKLINIFKDSVQGVK